MFNILIASPRWFCAWVKRAVSILDKVIKKYEWKEIFLTHDIIHNNHIKEKYQKLWIKTEEDLEKIPNNSIVVLSAHWSSKKTINSLKDKNCTLIDTSCPLVNKVHFEAISYAKRGYKIVYIWKENHPESKSFIEDFPKELLFISKIGDIENLEIWNDEKIILLNQTTLSVHEMKDFVKNIKEKFPQIELPKKEDICYATTNRQNAILEISEKVELFYVIGSSHSSNSNRLNELASKSSKSFLIESQDDINIEDLENITNVWISAWASAPENIIKSVIAFLENNWWKVMQFENKIKENVDFWSELIEI